MSLLLMAAVTVAAPSVDTCDNKPVYMVVAGPTHDRARMQAYAKAIGDSQLLAAIMSTRLYPSLPLKDSRTMAMQRSLCAFPVWPMQRHSGIRKFIRRRSNRCG
jgi:hypothetical protein